VAVIACAVGWYNGAGRDRGFQPGHTISCDWPSPGALYPVCGARGCYDTRRGSRYYLVLVLLPAHKSKTLTK